ncbi:MAG TPA: ABC transporter ATP-binding protein [Polyangiaceae bacterium]|nr:ABC transporter ATP-binding protein [Polyangiaceae bacterium]
MNRGVELERVTRVVGGEVHLADVSLAFEPGALTVVLGRTRAGKTSLLRVLAGLDRPTAGRVLAGGADVTGVDVRRRNVAMVYQQFVNYPSLTVYENIASPLRVPQRRLAGAEIDRRVRGVAEALGLGGLLGRRPAELSGGQQQRTALARALVKDADLLLLDEPLANLDYKLREGLRAEILQALRGALRERGAVVVYATAEPGEALLLGGRTAVLDEGRLVQAGPALEVYHAPATERVGQVFSDPQMNLFDFAVGEGGEARLTDEVTFAPAALAGPGPAPALGPGRYRLGVRAHHVRLAPSSPDDIRVPSVVLLEEVSGSETLLHAASGPLSIVAQIPGVHRHALGSRVDLFLASGRLFAFDAGGRLLVAPARPAPPAAPPPAARPEAAEAHGRATRPAEAAEAPGRAARPEATEAHGQD